MKYEILSGILENFKKKNNDSTLLLLLLSYFSRVRLCATP